MNKIERKKVISILIKFRVLLILMIIFILSCSERSTSTFSDDLALVETVDDTTGDGNKIYIVDRSDKRWDVSHAVNHYGFDPEQFRHGLGPFSIKPLLDPQLISPGESDYPGPNNISIVIGTTINGESRAYPLSTVVAFEIVDEQFDSIFVAVGYWPIVELTAVYSRQVLDRVLTLSASGWTYKGTFVLYDYETESLWYHLSGTDGLTCISGTYADMLLEEYVSTRTRWSDWFATHPDSKYLKWPPWCISSFAMKNKAKKKLFP
jgi:hypothetical protein